MQPLIRKRATLKDVALRAGVAKSTASDALSGKGRMTDETREAIRTIAREMGYFAHPLAQDLSRGGRHDTVSIFSAGLDTGVVTQTILQIQMALHREGFNVPLHITSHVAEENADVQIKAVTTLCHERPRALVCNTDNLHDKAIAVLADYIHNGGIVIAYGESKRLPCDTVVVDLGYATFQATTHLLELGHRNIELCWTLPVPAHHPWRKGFKKALRQFGLSSPPAPAPWSYQETYEIFSDEGSGQRMAENFLTLKNRPSGLVIINDKIASTFVQTLLKHSIKIPQQLSVVGHDNLPVSQHGLVPLTTVSYPSEIIALNVVDMLTSRISGHLNVAARDITIHGELISRASTASYRG